MNPPNIVGGLVYDLLFGTACIILAHLIIRAVKFLYFPEERKPAEEIPTLQPAPRPSSTHIRAGQP